MVLLRMADEISAHFIDCGMVSYSVSLWAADEISAHFIDCGMVSYSVSLWAVLGTKVLCKVGINMIYVLWRWQFMASCQSISHLL